MNVERRIATDDPSAADTHDSTNEKNLWLLIQLRWLAVSGQIATIFIVQSWDDVDLPTTSMLIVVGCLAVKNLLSWWRYDHHKQIGQAELLSELIADVLALTAQLYLSGGASNPFINLYLLQVIIGAVLLESLAIWVLFSVCSTLFVALTIFHRPISLPHAYGGNVFSLHIQGMLICFVLASILVIIFITRISKNIRDRDAQIASLRQRKAEDEHIVRLGLLASGAAHALGTPLATISVILGDWQRVRSQISDVDLTEDLHEMQQQIDRCKAIVSGILMSSGNARGEGTLRTTVRSFITDSIVSWREARQPITLEFDDKFGQDFSIVSDTALRQILFNVLDNAQEASAHRIGVSIERRSDMLLICIEDDGLGFSPEMLTDFGKPYRSTKSRPGGGLGLFLVVNVIRNLGGVVEASNRLGGGARLVLALPLSALSMNEGKNA